MAGSVEQVALHAAVVEGQRGRGDRDAALLLHLHPVARSRPATRARLDSTGLAHSPGVEEELLGEGRLPGVGVTDDGECATASRLGHRISHVGMAWGRGAILA